MAYWDTTDEAQPTEPGSSVPAAHSEAADIWDVSDNEKPETPPAAAPKKKDANLKAKIAEKDALRSAIAELGDNSGVSEFVMTEADKRALERQRELDSDMKNASDLLGVVHISDEPPSTAKAAPKRAPPSELDTLLSADPKTKDDFVKLSQKIFDLLIKRHQEKPQYAAFAEHHIKTVATPLKEVEIKKAANTLTTLASDKARAAKGGRKTNQKPSLGNAKSAKGATSRAYKDLDDFGEDPDDFM